MKKFTEEKNAQFRHPKTSSSKNRENKLSPMKEKLDMY